MDFAILFVVLACIIGFAMAWGVGANDLANIISTTMGSKAISVRSALIIAVVFEFAGAFLGSGQVTDTIRHGIVNTDALAATPYIFIYGMLALLLAGATWMGTASYFGMPVSITNAVVGGLVGFGSIVFGVHAIHWAKVGTIAISWVCSPLIAGTLGFILFKTIQRAILSAKDPAESVLKYVPIYFFLAGLVLGTMVILKGLAHFNIHLAAGFDILIAIASGLVVAAIGTYYVKHHFVFRKNQLLHEQFKYVESVFGVLMALTACAMVFAHGSNDVAVAVGPIAAILGAAQHPGQFTATFPAWVTFLGALGIVIGLLMYGRKVITTVGTKITALTPSRGYSATIAAASTVIVATSTGIPVSATQTLVGGVLGVGLARGIEALNLTVIRNILTSWVITIPIVACLAVVFFYILKFIFSIA